MMFLRLTIKDLNSAGKEAESTCMRHERKSGDGIVSTINTEKRSERYHAVNPRKSGIQTEIPPAPKLGRCESTLKKQMRQRGNAFPGRQAGTYQGAALKYV
jgi:hypothetical protein